MAEVTPPRVLVVHGDPGLRARIVAILRARGHSVSAVPHPARALDGPVVIVVDHRDLPLRTPAHVLALVAHRDEAAVLAAFAAGAASVLVGPLRGVELAARVAALTRGAAGTARARVGPIAIDTGARRVTLAGQPLELTRGEYELLRRLAAAPGRVFTKQELLRDVWDGPVAGPTRRLDAQVARLRRRLGEHRALLVTVWGVGYRLGG